MRLLDSAQEALSQPTNDHDPYAVAAGVAISWSCTFSDRRGDVTFGHGPPSSLELRSFCRLPAAGDEVGVPAQQGPGGDEPHPT
jgi:hypothetical protein